MAAGARVALLDVNVLVALFDPDHVHHDLAHDWFSDDGKHGWATCAMTENGFVRIASNPQFQLDSARPASVLAQLRTFCKRSGHTFWSEVISLRDERLFDLTAVAGHRQITDVYLLGLARRMNGRLATFDRSIPLAAVKGATRDHLVVIAPV